MRNFRLFLMFTLISVMALTACRQTTETPAPAATEPAPTIEETEEPAPPVPVETDEESDDEPPQRDASLPDAPILRPDATSTPTQEPEPTATPEEPTPTAEPTEDEEAPDDTESPEATEVPENETEPEETREIPAPTRAAPPATQSIVSTSALVIRDDETPAPPLIVTVSANREFPGSNFLITGLVRNGGTENYAGLDIIGTFFRADGSRHGPIEVNLQCPVLAPGDACPFRIDANAKGLTEVMLHPEGYPTTRTTAQVDVTNVSTSLDGIGYVHITGSVTNPNPVPVWDVTLNGVLIDAAGTIVSLGTDVLVGALDAGATATFDVPVRYQPYATYQLFVVAEPR